MHDVGVHGTVGDPTFATEGTGGDGGGGCDRTLLRLEVATAGSGATSVAAITAACVEVAHP